VQSPWQALIPDRVPNSQRGIASGLKAILDILSFIAGRRTSGYLIAQGATLQAVGVTSAVFLLVLGMTLWSIRRRQWDLSSPGAATDLKSVLSTFLIDWKSHSAFRIWFFNRALFWGGVIALNTFLLFYFTDVMGKSMPEAQRFFADLSTVLGVCVVLLSYPAGRLSDRWGRRPFILGACITAALGAMLLLAARTDGALYAAGALIGTGTGVFLTTNWALATELVPEHEAARFLGIGNIATAGASFLSRIAGGLLIDPINTLSGNPAAGYMLFFGLAFLGFLAAGFLILKIPPQTRISTPTSG
jgi:Na+/melibiose symporter-like transporter